MPVILPECHPSILRKSELVLTVQSLREAGEISQDIVPEKLTKKDLVAIILKARPRSHLQFTQNINPKKAYGRKGPWWLRD